MGGEEDTNDNIPTDPSGDAEMLTEDHAGHTAAEDERSQEQAMAKAASQIELVVLPIACVNEGKGAPLAMGIQRWWAQELARSGAKAAAPVFTMMAEQGTRKVPALLIYRDEWTDERALEGMSRFENAKRALVPNFYVDERQLKLEARLVESSGEGEDRTLTEIGKWSFESSPEELPSKIFELLQELAVHDGKSIEASTWQENFGTENQQAMLSFLVGLGNLSALQGRCVPATADQLLNPLMDAINRDSSFDPAMEALHAMVDILVAAQPDRSAIPLSIQALNIAAQKRKDDPDAWHHLALVARRLGDMATAVNAFNQAFNLAPESVPVATNFIATLRRSGDSANALKVAQFAVERGNEAPPVLAMLGSMLIEDDNFDSAEPFLRRAVEEGEIPSAYGDLANVLWDRGDEASEERSEDRAEALSLLKTAVERPQVAKSTLDMLLDLYEDDDVKEAATLLLEAAEKHENNPAVLSSAANLYLDGDEAEKARPFLTKILELPRRGLDDDAFARRSLLGLDVKDFDARYDKAVETINGDDATGQVEAAVFMREVIAQDKLFWQPHLMLALAIRDSEGDGAALSHLINAVRLRPNDAEIRDLIAAILRKQGKPAEAVEHLRVVVSLRPRDINPVVNLATCMRDANLFEECRQVCTAAMGMIPDHPEFKKILESLPPPKDQQN